MNKQFRLTKEGAEELQTELDKLLAERAPIAERIKNAREFGDLAENAEYTAALQEQDRVESRIAELEKILQNVEIITKPRSDKKVQLGSVVKLKGEGGRAKEFKIVGTVEADPLNGKISDESPIGQLLIGKIEGDKVELITPTETANYKIADIS